MGFPCPTTIHMKDTLNLTWVKTAETSIWCARNGGEHFGLCWNNRGQNVPLHFFNWSFHSACQLIEMDTSVGNIFRTWPGVYKIWKQMLQTQAGKVWDLRSQRLKGRRTVEEHHKKVYPTPNKYCLQGNVKKGWLKFPYLRWHSFL